MTLLTARESAAHITGKDTVLTGTNALRNKAGLLAQLPSGVVHSYLNLSTLTLTCRHSPKRVD